MPTLKQMIRPLLDIRYPNRTFSVRELKTHGARFFAYLDQHTNRKIALGRFEVAETAFLSSQVSPDDVFLDIGSNIGYFSVLMASRGARVRAFDPVPQNAALLNLTSVLNPDLEISPMQAAVSDKAGTMRFQIMPQTSLSRLVAADADQDASAHEVEVQVITIDDLKLDRVDMVKIDVEGAELSVLKGMTKTIKATRPKLFMIELVEEHLENFGHSLDDVIAFMRSMDYQAMALKNGSLTPYEGTTPVNDNFFFVRV